MWKLHLLLIDDEIFSRRLISQQLTQNGFEITTVTTAQMAWRKLIETPYLYELIILDRLLPDKNGITFLKQINEVAVLKHIPIIMITSHANDEDHLNAIKAGVVEFIYKPVNIDLLLFAIGNALNKYYAQPA